MKRFGKYAIATLMVAGTAFGATLATTAPADARVAVGIGIGVPGPYYGNPCANPDYRYYHPDYCYGYGPGYYGAAYPAGGFWITDSFGHRHWHAGGHGDGHWHHH